ncbi:MAG: metal ABC transporter permease [Fimbriiglobus sp.]
MPVAWLDSVLRSLTEAAGLTTFDVYPVLAVVLVGLACGLVGSLVVGNRMAFFSDAMAHTAFAGVGIALLGVVLATGARTAADMDPYLWVVPPVTAVIGSAVGIAMAAVRERTGLTNDTVIGVFFALSIGVAGMLLPQLPRGTDPDQLLFGSLVFVDAKQLLTLGFMTVAAAVVVAWRYNGLVFGSFNATLAQSRGVPLRRNNYLFVVLLALVVNLSITAVGVLLINALLVVPAAAAANLARNLRQFFWFTVAGSAGAAVLGYELSHRIAIPTGGRPLTFGPGGTIVVTCVAWFFVTMLLAGLRKSGRK